MKCERCQKLVGNVNLRTCHTCHRWLCKSCRGENADDWQCGRCVDERPSEAIRLGGNVITEPTKEVT